MAKIKDIYAREILDSRGNPTIEVELTLENNINVTASIPSGASTGSREALELRDGKGVLAAVINVNQIIRPKLIGKELDQTMIDRLLIELDGTQNKSRLGANAILGVSLATLKALAKNSGKELYEYVSNGKVSLPIPFINIINGGAHATNNLDIQEFMIVPMIKGFKEKIRCASEIFMTLKRILKEENLNTAVGDEGGFAPNLEYNSYALDLIIKAIKESRYVPGKDVFIALDVAASEMYDKQSKLYHLDGKNISKEELTKYYLALIKRYPIISIEDPYYEDDFESAGTSCAVDCKISMRSGQFAHEYFFLYHWATVTNHYRVCYLLHRAVYVDKFGYSRRHGAGSIPCTVRFGMVGS